ncbi:hypothetical protein AK88_03382 [Plasmodium fragile]|uniref:Myosin motor domain-containing protein n=1 Tax=Plasmodium fragile TaxID=5857 RepID=A0A0D9QJ44_PLAFR|nr:uncharacterized protein AK88_03382 [Plasmodium fragile]KJP86983.1 hypothetical protein AK88_03382 [Plasmodium fragile]
MRSAEDTNFKEGDIVWYENQASSPEEVADNTLFTLCRIIHKNDDDEVMLSKHSDYNGCIFTSKVQNIHKANHLFTLDQNDMMKLKHINDPALLHLLHERFKNKKFYTKMGPLLIFVNPNVNLNLCNQETIRMHKFSSTPTEGNLNEYTVALSALRNMSMLKRNQSIIVTGESGSGKSEITKNILYFLAYQVEGPREETSEQQDVAGAHEGTASAQGDESEGNEADENNQSDEASHPNEPSESNQQNQVKVAEMITHMNVLLDAFGSAKTANNNNSSRLSKFFTLHMDENGRVKSMHVKKFLFEKDRVMGGEHERQGENSFNIFYYVLNGSSDKFKEMYYLKDVTYYKMLRSRGSLGNGQIVPVSGDAVNAKQTPTDESAKFLELLKSMNYIFDDDKEIDFVFSVLSALLLLGNVETVKTLRQKSLLRKSILCESSLNYEQLQHFLEDSNEDLIMDENAKNFLIASKLLGIDPEQLVKYFTANYVFHDILLMKVHNETKIQKKIEAFIKTTYDELFNWIVHKINCKFGNLIGGGGHYYHENVEANYINVLDLAYFENGEQNSLTQLLVNTSNEAVRNMVVDFLFKKRIQLCREEGIEAASSSSSSCFNLERLDNEGLYNVLVQQEEESLFSYLESLSMKKVTENSNLHSLIVKKFSSGGYIKEAFSSILPGENNGQQSCCSSSSSSFVIVHSCGEVCYSSEQLVNQNIHILTNNFIELMKKSGNPYLEQLCCNYNYDPCGDIVEEKRRYSIQSALKLFRRKYESKNQMAVTMARNNLVELMKVKENTFCHFIFCMTSNHNRRENAGGEIVNCFDERVVFDQVQNMSLSHFRQLRGAGLFPHAFYFQELLDLVQDGASNEQAENVQTANVDAANRVQEMMMLRNISKSEWAMGQNRIFLTDLSLKILMQSKWEQCRQKMLPKGCGALYAYQRANPGGRDASASKAAGLINLECVRMSQIYKTGDANKIYQMVKQGMASMSQEGNNCFHDMMQYMHLEKITQLYNPGGGTGNDDTGDVSMEGGAEAAAVAADSYQNQEGDPNQSSVQMCGIMHILNNVPTCNAKMCDLNEAIKGCNPTQVSLNDSCTCGVGMPNCCTQHLQSGEINPEGTEEQNVVADVEGAQMNLDEVQHDDVQPEEVQPEEVEAEQVEPEQVEPEQAEPEQVEAEQVEPEEVEPEQVEPEEVEPEKVEPEEVEPEQVEPEEVEPEQVEPEEVEPEAADEDDANEEPAEEDLSNGEQLSGEQLNGEQSNTQLQEDDLPEHHADSDEQEEEIISSANNNTADAGESQENQLDVASVGSVSGAVDAGEASEDAAEEALQGVEVVDLKDEEEEEEESLHGVEVVDLKDEAEAEESLHGVEVVDLKDEEEKEEEAEDEPNEEVVDVVKVAAAAADEPNEEPVDVEEEMPQAQELEVPALELEADEEAPGEVEAADEMNPFTDVDATEEMNPFDQVDEVNPPHEEDENSTKDETKNPKEEDVDEEYIEYNLNCFKAVASRKMGELNNALLSCAGDEVNMIQNMLDCYVCTEQGNQYEHCLIEPTYWNPLDVGQNGFGQYPAELRNPKQKHLLLSHLNEKYITNSDENIHLMNILKNMVSGMENVHNKKWNLFFTSCDYYFKSYVSNEDHLCLQHDSAELNEKVMFNEECNYHNKEQVHKHRYSPMVEYLTLPTGKDIHEICLSNNAYKRYIKNTYNILCFRSRKGSKLDFMNAKSFYTSIEYKKVKTKNITHVHTDFSYMDDKMKCNFKQHVINEFINNPNISMEELGNSLLNLATYFYYENRGSWCVFVSKKRAFTGVINIVKNRYIRMTAKNKTKKYHIVLFETPV